MLNTIPDSYWELQDYNNYYGNFEFDQELADLIEKEVHAIQWDWLESTYPDEWELMDELQTDEQIEKWFVENGAINLHNNAYDFVEDLEEEKIGQRTSEGWLFYPEKYAKQHAFQIILI